MATLFLTSVKGQNIDWHTTTDSLFLHYKQLNDSESSMEEYKDSDEALLAKLNQLEIINASRKKHRAKPVELDIFASRVTNKTCKDACDYKYVGHWNVQGEKPYHRYGLNGGLDHISENASGRFGNISATENQGSIEQMMKDLHGLFMAEKAPHDGHKTNVIEKVHNYVGIGYYVVDGRFCYYEEFIDRYLDFTDVPDQVSVNQQFTLNFQTKSGQNNVKYIRINYEPLPQKMSPLQIQRKGSYKDYTKKYSLIVPSSGNNGKYEVPITLDKKGMYYIQILLEDKQSAKKHDLICASGIVIKTSPYIPAEYPKKDTTTKTKKAKRKYFNLGFKNSGICFGSPLNFNGIKFSADEKETHNINGLSFLFLSDVNDRTKRVNGLELGFLNVATRVNGIQTSLFFGTVEDRINGIATTLVFGDYDHVNGIAFSALVHSTNEMLNGISISGLYQVSEVSNGILVSGIGHVSDSLCRGITVSGIFNNLEHMKALSLAPVNLLDEGSGVQVGIVNKADQLTGVQFGLINIIKENPRPFKVLPVINFNFKKNKALRETTVLQLDSFITEEKTKLYYPSGKLKTEYTKHNGVLTGTYTEYHKNGKISMQTQYVNGKIMDFKRTYYDNGQLMNEEPFMNGEAYGEFDVYNRNGSIMFHVTVKSNSKK